MDIDVLLIEDSVLHGKIITDLLKANGIAVFTALTGEDGINELKVHKPDLVLVDTCLPGIDGFEVCRRIRKKYSSHELKLVVMTGVIDAIDATKARKAGADDYTVKTEDCLPLLEVVKNMLKKDL